MLVSPPCRTWSERPDKAVDRCVSRLLQMNPIMSSAPRGRALRPTAPIQPHGDAGVAARRRHSPTPLSAPPTPPPSTGRSAPTTSLNSHTLPTPQSLIQPRILVVTRPYRGRGPCFTSRVALSSYQRRKRR